MAGPGRQHDQAIHSQRDTGAIWQARFERRHEVPIDRIGGAELGRSQGAIVLEPNTLLRCIGKLGVAVGDLKAAHEDLEPLG